jgi:hypothetical protein
MKQSKVGAAMSGLAIAGKPDLVCATHDKPMASDKAHTHTHEFLNPDSQ